MSRVIHCPGGYVVRGADDDEIVTRAQRHADEAHGLALSREEALAMARPE